MARKLNTEEIIRLTPEEFKETPKIPLVVILDNVRSLHNVGSVFRTSDAYCVEKVILCGITATPPNAEIHKSALGAEFSVDWAYYKETTEAVNELKQAGYTILAIEQAHDSINMDTFKAEKGKKYAVILGNEVKGVQQSVIDLSDDCLELPQFGTKHSLNVSVTAGIVIWEFAKLFR
ncbi:MAG: RNA methyltransferase [Paludibacteraceae bacterium]|nr:RNA methyltransferase [Paludibacteraceae bacterium]